MAMPTESIFSFVDGSRVTSQAERTIGVINPSNGRPCCLIPAGHQADVDLAVASARKAFEDGRWSELSPSLRKKILHRWAELIDVERRVLDALDAEDMGKPVGLARGNAAEAAGGAEFCAEAADKLSGEVPSTDTHSLVIQRWVPRGVVAAVVPWNFPTYNAVLKVAPALAAGNTVVLKPSELSPRSSIRLAELAVEAGLPAGAFNVMLGSGETIGRALGLHLDVDMVTFTGSTAVGKAMLQYSGQSNMKLVMTECGGKSPHIVFDDGVDLAAAGRAIADLLLTNQGQLCTVGSRLLVQRSIEKRLLEQIVESLGNVVLGDALDSKTTFGPLASSTQCARVMHYIERARMDGAETVTGGRRVCEETGGYFVEPTIFRGVSPGSRIAQEEIFGPVLAVTAFDNEQEALRVADGTIYGLAAYVWTTELSRGLRIARALRSPVTVNAVAPKGDGAGYALSWEPAKQSGIGIEGGLAGVEAYLRRQPILFNYQ